MVSIGAGANRQVWFSRENQYRVIPFTNDMRVVLRVNTIVIDHCIFVFGRTDTVRSFTKRHPPTLCGIHSIHIYILASRVMLARE